MSPYMPLNKEGPAAMLKQLESSLTIRRWLSVAAALLLFAGIWAIGSRPASAATWTVEARDFAFTPQDITIAVGDTITWVNGDAESHAVEGGSLSSPEIRPGDTYSATFSAPEDLIAPGADCRRPPRG